MDPLERMGSDSSPGWIHRRRILIGLILLELSFGSFRAAYSSVCLHVQFDKLSTLLVSTEQQQQQREKRFKTFSNESEQCQELTSCDSPMPLSTLVSRKLI
jgi:hypothetical protein